MQFPSPSHSDPSSLSQHSGCRAVTDTWPQPHNPSQFNMPIAFCTPFFSPTPIPVMPAAGGLLVSNPTPSFQTSALHVCRSPCLSVTFLAFREKQAITWKGKNEKKHFSPVLHVLSRPILSQRNCWLFQINTIIFKRPQENCGKFPSRKTPPEHTATGETGDMYITTHACKRK